MRKRPIKRYTRQRAQRPVDEILHQLSQVIVNINWLCRGYDLGQISAALPLSCQLAAILSERKSGERNRLLRAANLDNLKIRSERPCHGWNFPPGTVLASTTSSLVFFQFSQRGARVEPMFMMSEDNVENKTKEEYSVKKWLEIPAHAAISKGMETENIISRKILIDVVRNKEGGAHIDISLNERERRNSRADYTQKQDTRSKENDIIQQHRANIGRTYAGIRQIAHELLVALDQHNGVTEDKNSYVQWAYDQVRKSQTVQTG